MLQKILSPADIAAALEGEQPPPLRMPHHPSALQHEAEIDKAITDMIASDALRNLNDLGFNDTDLERYKASMLTIGMGYVFRRSTNKGRPIWTVDCSTNL